VAKRASTTTSAEFHVTLDGLALSPEQHAEIEAAIRRAVLEQIAGLDFQGDLVVSPLGQTKALGGGGGATSGIVARVAK
jgi:hypothetical protein